MMCRNPFVKGIVPFPCGQCLFCRVNRRRLWTHRIMLEAALHAHSSFWTLTYEDDQCPRDGSLVPAHLSNFIKRVRYFAKEEGLPSPRFYGVGEYGDLTERPHFHVALFGVDDSSSIPVRSWPFGFTHGAELNSHTAGYLAGYVTKKLDKNNPSLGSRQPEFARMSLKPGIGAGSVPRLAEILNTKIGMRNIAIRGDIPYTLKHGSKEFPLGRYLGGRLRHELGFAKTGAPESVIRNKVEELRPLYQASGSKASYVTNAPFLEKVKMFQRERRFRLFNPKRLKI